MLGSRRRLTLALHTKWWQSILYFLEHLQSAWRRCLTSPRNAWAKCQGDDESPWQDIRLYRLCKEQAEHHIMSYPYMACPCPIMSYMHDIVHVHTCANWYVPGSIPKAHLCFILCRLLWQPTQMHISCGSRSCRPCHGCPGSDIVRLCIVHRG